MTPQELERRRQRDQLARIYTDQRELATLIRGAAAHPNAPPSFSGWARQRMLREARRLLAEKGRSGRRRR